MLLARAQWFREWLAARDRATDLLRYPSFRSAAAAAASEDALAREEWAEDALADYFESEFAEDEAIEDYYFSSSAGPSRITVGNRPHGPGGFLRAGHRCARPGGGAPKTPKSATKARVGVPALPKSAPDGAGTSSKGQGRRARRNARRSAAEDVPGFE